MPRTTSFARLTFAGALVGLGVLSLVYGDFALQWQPVPEWVPGRTALAYLSAASLLTMGAGLAWRRTAPATSRVLFVYALLWFTLLEVPRMAKDPLVEGNWSGAGEIAAILAGCWILYASLHRGEESVPRLGAGDRSRRVALRLFALGIIRLAAGMEAGMIVVFTALVWVPLVVASPSVQLHWTGFFISWIVGAAAWVVAESKRPSASEVHPDLAGLPRPTAMDAAAKAPESVPVRPMRDRGQPSH